MMWIAIFAIAFLLAIFAAAFLVKRALRFGIPKKLYEKNKWLGIAAAFWPILICTPFLFIGVPAFVVVFIHLFFFWVIVDLFAKIIRKIAKKEHTGRYINGFIALALTTIYLTYGWVMAHTVFETGYTLTTEKELGADSLRVVALADLHLGITIDGDEFFEECERINEAEPDVVLIVGDFVDDATERDDMFKACEALGTLNAKYGVYFSFGNHDRGYFRRETFTEDELYSALLENGVNVLTDEVTYINGDVCIVGREDASDKDRKTAAEIMKGVDRSKYVIVLDHQPNDYDALACEAPDLVISGHTHGGHMFPIGPIGLLMGANDAIYGIEERGDTSFIVTSGISGWEIPFKTFTVSEYVVIDISSK